MTSSSPHDRLLTDPHIGIDESGKGDYFGPLVIAAVFVDTRTTQELLLLGTRDSKKLSDTRVRELALAIKQRCPYSVVAIGPERYNQLYAKIKNLNRLLAWGHARALENMLDQVECRLAIADQFGNKGLVQNALMDKAKNIELIQRTKAESDPAVAAASIVARAEFLASLARLSQHVGTTLPKGASHAVHLAARTVVRTHGAARLETVAKMHFRTTRAVLEGSQPG